MKPPFQEGRFIPHRKEMDPDMADIPSLYDLSLKELTDWVIQEGEPSYRARQIFHNLYRRGVADPSQMVQLPADLRNRLSRSFPRAAVLETEVRQSKDGTRKWLFRLSDKQLLETVLIPSGSRNTVCVSTQVGCAYSCAFCASGLLGFRRSLLPGEIVQQVVMANRALGGNRVTNVVFMGMGEPLANYQNLLKAVRILNDKKGLGLGARRITISTVGLIPMVERLARENLQVELSVSLLAPNDELRGNLMPVNRTYPLRPLIAACRGYTKGTKRIVTFEYILIDRINDRLEQAKELADLLRGLKCKVNLIPFHPIPGTPWRRPSSSRMLAFERFLKKSKIPCTLRRSRGLEVEGACGQLRLKVEEREGSVAPIGCGEG